MQQALSSLDESIWVTFWRDLKRLAANTKAVLLVFRKSTSQFSTREGLRDWDLWGPLVSVLSFCMLLTKSADGASSMFSVVFLAVVIGSFVLTLNILLLGGHIIFLQAISLIGYCTLPTFFAAGTAFASTNKAYRSCLAAVSIVWSSYASVPFTSASVSGKRKELAIYPIMLLYLSLAVLFLVSL